MLFVNLQGTKKDIKWYIRMLMKNPQVDVVSVSEMIPKKEMNIEEYLRADIDNKYYRVKIDVRKKDTGRRTNARGS